MEPYKDINVDKLMKENEELVLELERLKISKEKKVPKKPSAFSKVSTQNKLHIFCGLILILLVGLCLFSFIFINWEIGVSGLILAGMFLLSVIVIEENIYGD